jgi:hypothetical protein
VRNRVDAGGQRQQGLLVCVLAFRSPHERLREQPFFRRLERYASGHGAAAGVDRRQIAGEPLRRNAAVGIGRQQHTVASIRPLQPQRRQVQRQPAREARIGLRRREGDVHQGEWRAAGGETPTCDRRGSIAAIVEQQNEPEGIRGEGPSGEIALGEKGVEAGLDAILLVPHRNCSDHSQRWSDSVWQLKHQIPSRRYALNNTSLKH